MLDNIIFDISNYRETILNKIVDDNVYICKGLVLETCIMDNVNLRFLKFKYDIELQKIFKDKNIYYDMSHVNDKNCQTVLKIFVEEECKFNKNSTLLLKEILYKIGEKSEEYKDMNLFTTPVFIIDSSTVIKYLKQLFFYIK